MKLKQNLRNLSFLRAVITRTGVSGGYDAVWPCINLLTCRSKVLYPYHTPETSVNFYHIARRHFTTDFNINNLSVVFI